MTKIKKNEEIKNVYFDGKPVENPNFAEFKDKQFARHFLMTGGDLKKSFELTFGKAGSHREMDTMLNRPLVAREIDKLLPSDKEIADVMVKALKARTPDYIRWGEKKSFIDTILELKGYTKKNDGDKTQNNIIMMVEK